MFDDDNGFFNLFPDMDGDGDHDVMDFMIMDDIFSDEERETERYIELDDEDADDFDY